MTAKSPTVRLEVDGLGHGTGDRDSVHATPLRVRTRPAALKRLSFSTPTLTCEAVVDLAQTDMRRID